MFHLPLRSFVAGSLRRVSIALLGAAVATVSLGAPLAHASAAEAAPASFRRDVVAGHGTDTWTLHLQAGVSYRITVRGDGDSDLDAYLYDENGYLIDSDDDGTDVCILEVTPRWTGPFELHVVNRGGRANAYTLTVTP